METQRTWEEHGNTGRTWEEHGNQKNMGRTWKHRTWEEHGNTENIETQVNLNNTEWPYEQKDNC